MCSISPSSFTSISPAFTNIFFNLSNSFTPYLIRLMALIFRRHLLLILLAIENFYNSVQNNLTETNTANEYLKETTYHDKSISKNEISINKKKHVSKNGKHSYQYCILVANQWTVVSSNYFVLIIIYVHKYNQILDNKT